MTKGLQGKYCESCSRKATTAYVSQITGELTYSCQAHADEAEEIWRVLNAGETPRVEEVADVW